MDQVDVSPRAVAIPEWDGHGVIPATGSASATSRNRSPYPVALVDFVLRFASTAARRDIVSGFLRYRKALRRAGFVRGFQWIDGSFIEDVETIESRDPRDIDVVTFFHLPKAETQQTLMSSMPQLFRREDTRDEYRVHAYYVQLDETPELLVEQATYWNSLWSHRRNGRWKGYVQIALSPSDDREAKANLDEMNDEGGAT